MIPTGCAEILRTPPATSHTGSSTFVPVVIQELFRTAPVKAVAHDTKHSPKHPPALAVPALMSRLSHPRPGMASSRARQPNQHAAIVRQATTKPELVTRLPVALGQLVRLAHLAARGLQGRGDVVAATTCSVEQWDGRVQGSSGTSSKALRPARLMSQPRSGWRCLPLTARRALQCCAFPASSAACGALRGGRHQPKHSTL